MNEAPTFDTSAEVLKRTYLALKAARARIRALEAGLGQPIAVVGMACRLPGGANDPEALWSLMERGAHASVPVPPDRWPGARFYHASADAPGRTHAAQANFLTVPVAGFDAPFFGISAREAVSLDPQQRLLLEVAWEALERAGLDPAALRGRRGGVYVGISSDDYAQAHRHSGHLERIDGYALTGTCFAPAAGRLSYCLGLEGPSLAVDTACSSSLVAVHLACQGLRNGECDLALAGGVNLILSPVFHIASSKLGTISPDGVCKTFDAAANGYGRGEGCGVVVLKRLADAQAQGDPILAVLRGSAVNQDGRSNGLTAPNGLAQEKVIRQALAAAGLEPADIGYVEVHGTGTALGDPIEVEAIGRVMQQRDPAEPVILGTAKTNIGHLEAAAGIAGLIRTILILDRGMIPRHLHLDTPNPHVPWGRYPFDVATAPRLWPSGDRPRRAGVSSFGFSGTNAHVVVEAAPPPPVATPDQAGDHPLRLLPLSARSPDALAALAGAWAEWLEDTAPRLPDAVLTAGAGRSHFPCRLAALGATADAVAADLRRQAAAAIPGPPPARPRLAMLFTGQGSQYPGMGRGLFETEPVFRAAMEACDTGLRGPLGSSLIAQIYGDEASDEALRQTAIAQPAIFAVEIALARLWQSWGIVPDIVCGHSVGEFAAAHVAGILTLDDALTLVAARGRLMQALPAGGAMAALFADEATIRPLLPAGVSIAAVNRPGEVVVSGPAGAVTGLVERLAAHGVDAQPLRVSHAFHSTLMRPMLADFAALAAAVRYRPAALPVISTVTGAKALPTELADPSYWTRQIEATVRFADAARALDGEADMVLEVGPAPILSGLMRQIRPDDGDRIVPSLKPRDDDRRLMLTALGALYRQGLDIDWAATAPTGRRLAAPTYRFQRESFYLPPLADAGAGAPLADAGHPVLGQRLRSPLLPPGAALHQALFTADRPAFLKEHQIFGRIISPAAAHLAMALAAFGPGRQLEDVAFTAPLVIADGPGRLVQTLIDGDGAYRLVSQPADQPGAPWIAHSSGRGSAAQPPPAAAPALAAVRARCSETMTAQVFYDLIESFGYHTGPGFRCVREIAWGTDEALCRVVPAEPVEGDTIPPGLIDSLLQTALPACQRNAAALLSDGYVLIPLHIGRLTLWSRPDRPLLCHTRITAADTLVKATITACDEAGTPVLEIADFLLRRTDRATLYQDPEPADDGLHYQPVWQPVPVPAMVPDAVWLIVDGPGPWPAVLTEVLTARGAVVAVVPPDAAAAADLLRTRLAAGPAAIQLLLPAQGDGLDAIADTEASCRLALDLVRILAGLPERGRIRLWLITRGAQTVTPEDGADPMPALDGGALWGFGRAVATEYPELRPGLVDLAAVPAAGDVAALVAALGGPEDQIALRRGMLYAARLERAAEPPPSELADSEACFLDKGPRQTLDDLVWRRRPRQAPGPGDVEVAIEAAGLNFRDVLNTLGHYPGEAGLLGFEAAGTVSRVGAGIDDLAPGSPVIVLGVPGCIASHITVARGLVAPRPAGLGPAAAVTLPAAFLTAHYALNHLGKMQAGETVLIHAAAGGVGLAAVQLALAAGATVFATAGSDDKRAHLAAMGVRHIYSSRSLDFADEIRADTGGRGVDLVLNALSGAYIEASFAVLAPRGRFLEMGKIGIWTETQAAARVPGCLYRPFDLAAVVKEDPVLIGHLFAEILSGIAAGRLSPLPVTLFPMASAQEAFRYMAQARHIGKVVLERTAESRAERIAGTGLIRADGTYLITGGLGALGLRLADWLVAAGARHLVLCGRRPPGDAARAALAALHAAGADVTTIAADMADEAAVTAVMAQVAADHPPLRGVIHAAGVLADGMLADLDWERFQAVLAPKLRAAWHLHRATVDRDLDLFVLFSSIAAVIGNLGQGNYAAANGFLDGLARHRRRCGLPAVSINWGPWAESGMAADLDSDHFAAQGIAALPPAQALSLFDRVLRTDRAQPVIAAMDWPAFAAARGLAPGHGLFASLVSAATDMSGGPRSAALDMAADLAAVLPAERPARLRRYLQDLARQTLGYGEGEAIVPDRPLVEQGFDSLMAVDMRNRLNRSLDRILPASLLFDYPTLDKIARYLLEEVILFDDEPPPEPPRPSTEALLDELERLIG